MPKVVTADLSDGVTVYSVNPGEGEVIGTIGLPTRDHVNAATVTSLITSATTGHWLVAGKSIHVNICQGSILTLQRNELVQRMRGDWLLFIDDDMVWQPEQIAQLIASQAEHDLDMVGGLCFRRSEPHQPTLFMREAPNQGPYNFLEDWTPGEIVEVDATGMAFTLIHRRVFERIVQVIEERPGWTMPPLEVRAAQPPPKYFTWNGQTGEDLRFCELARATGSRIWVDTSIEIGHVAEKVVGYRDFLYAVATRDEAIETARTKVNTTMGLPTLTRAEARRRLGL